MKAKKGIITAVVPLFLVILSVQATLPSVFALDGEIPVYSATYLQTSVDVTFSTPVSELIDKGAEEGKNFSVLTIFEADTKIIGAIFLSKISSQWHLATGLGVNDGESVIWEENDPNLFLSPLGDYSLHLNLIEMAPYLGEVNYSVWILAFYFQPDEIPFESAFFDIYENSQADFFKAQWLGNQDIPNPLENQGASSDDDGGFQIPGPTPLGIICISGGSICLLVLSKLNKKQ